MKKILPILMIGTIAFVFSCKDDDAAMLLIPPGGGADENSPALDEGSTPETIDVTEEVVEIETVTESGTADTGSESAEGSGSDSSDNGTETADNSDETEAGFVDTDQITTVDPEKSEALETPFVNLNGVCESYAIKANGISKAQNSNRKWFLNPNGGYHTYWSNVDFELQFKDCKTENLDIVIEVQNYSGPLKSSYSDFIVDVFAKTKKQRITVPASDDTSYFSENLFVSSDQIKFKWKNDSYKKGVHDANIWIKSVTLNRNDSSGVLNYVGKTAMEYKYLLLLLGLSGIALMAIRTYRLKER